MTYPLSKAAVDAAEAEYDHITGLVRNGKVMTREEMMARILRAALAAWEPTKEQQAAAFEEVFKQWGSMHCNGDWDHVILAAVRTEADP